MFQPRPRRPMPPARMMSNRRPRQIPAKPKQSLISHFRTPEGNLDFEKITVTFQQAKQAYDQVSPIVSKFLKK